MNREELKREVKERLSKLHEPTFKDDAELSEDDTSEYEKRDRTKRQAEAAWTPARKWA